MKLTKYLALELKTKKEGPLYAIRTMTKAGDLVLLLNYLFFEYTRKDLDLIIKNLEIIDEEMDDEIVIHGSSRSLLVDLNDPTTLYISLLADYLKFEDSPAANALDVTFVDQLKKKKFEHFKINRKCFLKLLQDWHAIIEKKPTQIVLYQNNLGQVGFQSFATKEAADLYPPTH